MFLKRFITRRRGQIAERLYSDGYDYAAGALLRNAETPLSIEGNFMGFDENEFEKGCRDAINRLIGLNIIDDDRV